MFGATLSHITAEACVPEQLEHYVRSVSGRDAFLCSGYAAYTHAGHAVLVAYPRDTEAEAPGSVARPPLAEALDELALSCSGVTVLAPFRPAEAPDSASSSRDQYWDLPVPPQPGQKLRNMLKRAAREVTVEPEEWDEDHAALVRHYLQSRPLAPGTRAIFTALPEYCARAGQAGAALLLLAARSRDGRLAAFSMGDYTALRTAFYMFSFRRQDAPPGTADLLLAGLVEEAHKCGHARMNLGLGISGGISFFKKKWQAEPGLPYVETSWLLSRTQKNTAKPGLLTRLGGLFR